MLVVLTISTLLYLFLLQQLTLTPAPYDDNTSGFIHAVISFFAQYPLTSWLSFDVVEFLANVALFMPLAILLWCWLWPSGMRIGLRCLIIVGIGFITTLTIEISQHLFFSTRVADPRDVIANTLGTIVGLCGCLLWYLIRRHRSALTNQNVKQEK